MPATPHRAISACFPAYQDAGTITSMVLGAWIVLNARCEHFEIVVCNDGSTDATGLLLDELARRMPELRVIHHETNQGYGAALKTTFSITRCDFVFYTDGDAQYDVRELTHLIDAWQPGIDVVNGYKISRNDPWHRIVLGRVYHLAMRAMFKLPIRDVDCDFRLMRRELLQSLPLESRDGTLPLELVKQLSNAGARFAEVPVHHFHRVYGRSQFFNAKRLLRVIREVLRLWHKLMFVPWLNQAKR
jgi:glycosyltransferase involved in cell wall biosynthesis